MNRRSVLKFGASLSCAAYLARSLSPRRSAQASDISAVASGGIKPVDPEVASALKPQDWQPFSESLLQKRAQDLSLQPYAPSSFTPAQPAASTADALDYDGYRDIRFDKAYRLWLNENPRFSAELFHGGYIYKTPVQIFVVENGQAGELRYDRRLFTIGPEALKGAKSIPSYFSGFRLLTFLDAPNRLDEFVVFQGASYFRSKAAGQEYGLSARGLAINTAQPPGDEFPEFRSFWIEKPQPNASFVVVYALLDSESICGFYKFVISNTHNTVMDVQCTLYPRKVMSYPGIAPLTSMFYYAPSNEFRGDDVRERVHDSDGLLIANGRGETLWRPLINTNRLQYSSFLDDGVKGFGLMQRERRPDHYEDFDARYEDRPSLWVEPEGDWGEGWVDLIELPTRDEYFDNIVVFWRPKQPLEPGKAYSYKYRLTWGEKPRLENNIATISQTFVGASTQHPEMRLFWIDFVNTDAFEFCEFPSESCRSQRQSMELEASAGQILNVAFRHNKISKGYRLGFEYLPAPGVTEADLRCSLMLDGKPVSEVWIYRWTA